MKDSQRKAMWANLRKNNFKTAELEKLKINEDGSINGFKRGDYVTANNMGMNGRVGKILAFEINPKEDRNDFNYAKVVPTFGGIERLRINSLRPAMEGGKKTTEHPSYVLNGDTYQLPLTKKSKQIIDMQIKNAVSKEKQLKQELLGKPIKIGKEWGQIIKVDLKNTGVIGRTEMIGMRVKLTGGKTIYHEIAYDNKNQIQMR